MSFSTYPQNTLFYPHTYSLYLSFFPSPFPHTKESLFPVVDTRNKNSYTFPRANSITITVEIL